MAGMVLVALEKNDEAVFINIVGSLDWKQLSQLGKKLKIEQLEDIPAEVKPQTEKKR